MQFGEFSISSAYIDVGFAGLLDSYQELLNSVNILKRNALSGSLTAC